MIARVRRPSRSRLLVSVCLACLSSRYETCDATPAHSKSSSRDRSFKERLAATFRKYEGQHRRRRRYAVNQRSTCEKAGCIQLRHPPAPTTIQCSIRCMYKMRHPSAVLRQGWHFSRKKNRLMGFSTITTAELLNIIHCILFSSSIFR